MKPSGLVTLAFAVTAVACSTLQVSTDYAPGTDFSTYRTFTLKHGAPGRNPITVQIFEIALANALQARGLTQVRDGGDLNVFDHFVLGKDTPLATYGYGGWGGGSEATQFQEIPAGTVVVDLVDAKTNRMVWRGTFKDDLLRSASPEERRVKSDRIARKFFENFPPQPKK